MSTDNDHGITGELREWIDTIAWLDDSPVHKNILAIADRIDAEHERLMAERRRSCVFYDAERNYCSVHDEGDMVGLGYARLPVDADGIPVHIGDVMENIVCPSVHREVTGVGVECFYGWDDGNGRYSQFDANRYRHHHTPTVEDVLRDMLDAWGELPSNMTNEAIIAEYAAKLRLSGGDAE